MDTMGSLLLRAVTDCGSQADKSGLVLLLAGLSNRVGDSDEVTGKVFSKVKTEVFCAGLTCLRYRHGGPASHRQGSVAPRSR